MHEDIAGVLGVSRGTYVNRRKANKVGADDVIAVARHYGFNELQALLDLGFVDSDATAEYMEQMPGFTLVATRKATKVTRLRTRGQPKLNPAVQL
ncbi:immunity repressor [Gordonia phage Neville]|uniref:Immunity repressor n=2 Tax=Nevillevirus TaxID=3044773 RepID=A0A515MH01_9CAUD|nr:immunity repressor [Gordonia phage Neville]YP_010246025.1 immunity repressor [Gordonia phage Trax]AXQ64412.1 immunity repressor [Gordonia phage Neville]QDM55927.1 immunity repressor [Gordonia phage Trax]